MNGFMMKLQPATNKGRQRHVAYQFYLVLRSGEDEVLST